MQLAIVLYKLGIMPILPSDYEIDLIIYIDVQRYLFFSFLPPPLSQLILYIWVLIDKMREEKKNEGSLCSIKYFTYCIMPIGFSLCKWKNGYTDVQKQD